MRKIIIISFILITLILFGVSCGGDTGPKLPTDEELLQVGRDMMEAFNNENVEAYMDKLDPSSPLYEDTKKAMEVVFPVFDVRGETIEANVLEKTATEAKVHYIQITSGDDPNFRDNKMEAIDSLRKVDGKWKVYDTEITGVEYLE